MHRSIIATLSVVSFTLAALNQSTNDLMYRDQSLPVFTDQSLYNAADQDENPLGWLKRDSSTLSIGLSHSLLKLADQKSGDERKTNEFVLPYLRAGQPHAAYFQVFYQPSYFMAQSSQNRPNALDTTTLKLPLHKFGFTLVGSIASGYLQGGIAATGSYGKENGTEGEFGRTIMGVNLVDVFVGSQVHELVRFGFHGGASGGIDTLYVPDKALSDSVQDRFFEGNIPAFGGYIDFGKKDFPVSSYFSMGYAIPRFVYVTKGAPYHIQKTDGGNENVIKGDSLTWDWQTVGTIPLGAIKIHPGLTFGKWRNNSQFYSPSDDNHPIHYGQALKDFTWKTSVFHFGVGTSAEILSTHSVWFEYGFQNARLACGDAWVSSLDDKEELHSIRVGAKGAIHSLKLLGVPDFLGLWINAGYFVRGENNLVEQFQNNGDGYIGILNSGSNLFRYSPENLMGSFRRVSGLTIGTEVSYFNMLNGYFGCTFVNEKGTDKYSGVALNSRLVLSL